MIRACAARGRGRREFRGRENLMPPSKPQLDRPDAQRRKWAMPNITPRASAPQLSPLETQSLKEMALVALTLEPGRPYRFDGRKIEIELAPHEQCWANMVIKALGPAIAAVDTLTMAHLLEGRAELLGPNPPPLD